jgi:ATP-dependent Clp protease adaptor protein ClpS
MSNNEFHFEWEQSEGEDMFFYLSEESLLPDEDIAGTAIPPRYRVIMLNDDATPIDFVCFILETVFHFTHEEAQSLTLKIHQQGKAVCGVYTRDVAETIIGRVMDFTSRYDHPLQCVLQREVGYAVKES